MKLRRGFKSEAERISQRVRRRLGISQTDRLDPVNLARELGIPVLGIRDLLRHAERPKVVETLLGPERDSFSAMTLVEDSHRIIICNESHPPSRRASNLAHEISHALLNHVPETEILAGGCRYWDQEMEEEATWLGGALLVPRDGALAVAGRGLQADEIAENYGVSPKLCQWRINQTGIPRQLRGFG